MGLDTSHNAWHGAYGSFARWRNTIARAVGLPIEHNPELGSGESYVLDWERFERKNYQGEWDEMPADPLLVLLVHSDCDGQISPEHAGPLADRLEELLPKIESRPHDFHEERTRQFIAGLRAAAAAGEPVDFH